MLGSSWIPLFGWSELHFLWGNFRQGEPNWSRGCGAACWWECFEGACEKFWGWNIWGSAFAMFGISPSDDEVNYYILPFIFLVCWNFVVIVTILSNYALKGFQKFEFNRCLVFLHCSWLCYLKAVVTLIFLLKKIAIGICIISGSRLVISPQTSILIFCTVSLARWLWSTWKGAILRLKYRPKRTKTTANLLAWCYGNQLFNSCCPGKEFNHCCRERGVRVGIWLCGHLLYGCCWLS